MQYALTVSIEFVFVSSVVFFAAQFVLGLVNCYRPQPQTCGPQPQVQEAEPAFVPNPDGFASATPEDAALVEMHQAFVAHYWAKRPTANVVPFRRPAKSATVTEWAALDPFQLRKACQQHGIKWRNAKGPNKHLSKAEMITALQSAQSA